MRRAPLLVGAEVIGRRELVPAVLDLDVPYEAVDDLQSGIALRDGRPERCPVDGSLRVHMRLPALGRESGEALQQVLRIRHREASGSAEVKIGFDGLSELSNSGH